MPKFQKLAAAWVIICLCGLLAACGDTPTATPAPTPTEVPFTPTAVVPTTAAETTLAPATTAVATTEAPPTATSAISMPTIPPAASPTLPPTAAPVSIQRYQPIFAKYQPAQIATKTPSFPKYTVKQDLSNIGNLNDFKLSAAQRKLLAQNYFVVSPSEFKQFYQAYESFRYDQIPTYVSTDSVANVYHLLFDKILRETETNYLTQDLKSLNKALLDATLKEYNSLAGTDLENAATQALAFVAVASRLIDPTNFQPQSLPNPVQTLVEAEYKLIDAGGGIAASPIFGSDYKEDYSQYIPRGHYTKSEDLKNYFRAMMWYGRLTFRAKSGGETQSALLLTQALLNGTANGQKAGDYWKLLYDTTAFFVGTSDDLTYLDYAAVARQIWGDTVFDNPQAFSDKTKLASFQQAVNNLPPPKINSMITFINQDQETQIKGMRLMGQRFTLDAFIFQNLIWRNVGTLDKPRDLPKGLDVFSALGSQEAGKLLDQAGETSYANYKTQLTKVQQQVSALSIDTWTQNLYWSWLYLLRPYTEARGAGYPAYMQNEAWQRKQLVAGLGSWTELKHDTLLYAKQVYAERGGGPEELPTGFVEPEPEFYSRVAALAGMTRDGLTQRNMLDSQYAGDLKKLQDYALTLKTIAEKELAGQPISNDERDFIAYWGANIEFLTLEAADAADATGRKYLDQQDGAVVADVATGLEQVLEEGTGRENLIYVAVQVNGKVILTEGVVYSQYEFTVPPANRLTDEAWQKQLNSGNAPPLEAWKQSYMTAP